MLAKARDTLKSVFGFSNFRPLQEEIITNILEGHDSLVVMPTGGGKSLCYQIPGIVGRGLTLVVSPLISLMQDQVAQLRQLGVAAEYLNSSLSAAQYDATLAELKNNRLKLLYLAPETLLKPRVLKILDGIEVGILAIDEAHCISEWGHDFRPEYRQIAEVRQRFSAAVCLALTATATPRVRQDISTNLGFAKGHQFLGSFNRDNLFLRVVPKSRPLAQVVEQLKKFPDQSGIIYCATRRQVDELADHLAKLGFSVAPYHAGLTDQERMRNQEAFIRDDLQIIVATIAFGMGIDKPNVRFVIHYDLPKNLEGYYQEIGRAGRDGLHSQCILLFSYGDIHKIKYFIDRKTDSEKRLARMHLDAMVGYAESTVCRRRPLLGYFGEEYPVADHEGGCGMCDNCLIGQPDLVDLSVAAQKFLSCVKRTGEMFGANHVIDVLRGAKNKKVLQHNHQNLTTYGIGGDLSRAQWFHLSRQCLQRGLLDQDQEYGGLRLTPMAWPLLRGEEKLMGILVEDRSEPVVGRKTVVKGEMDCDHDLFAILRGRRKILADSANVPPYAVFSDRTLVEMAAVLPRTADDLLEIHGVGQVKLERYGDIFLGEISTYCREKGIPRPEIVPDESRVNRKDSVPNHNSGRIPRFMEVGGRCRDGWSIPRCMGEYRVKQSTILTHLTEYLRHGHSVPAKILRDELLISPEEQAEIRTLFLRLGPDRLGPVHHELGGKVDYDTLRLMQLLIWLENPEPMG
ncbi:MAG: DNA helicase RecQ [Proteobacteria bacterium]|nr:DNA helicase RecQ [Pseudomonadota bacterium]MBU1688765.1 DNA helicase RecQ [Pseudomonadota bacterium]